MRLPRQIKNSFLFALLIFSAQKVCAQIAPPDDFFNGGAQLYISNNIPAALEKTESGLKIYPDDEKLQKLEKLLKQQQQNQQQQNQKNQSQQNQSQNNKQNSPPQNSQQPQKPDEQKQNQADQKKNDQDQKPQDQQAKPGEMTPEEAKKLLDAQKDNEQVLQVKPQDKPLDDRKPVKDW